MKSLKVLSAILLTVGMLGCENSPKPHPQDHAEANRAMIQWLNNTAIDNAIIRQHTLYPYHFVQHGEALNDLGRRDVMVLSNYFRMNPGRINVRKAETPDALYNARIQRVMQAMEQHGVDLDRIELVEDGFPGGDGASSERAMQIREIDEPGARTGFEPITTSGRGSR